MAKVKRAATIGVMTLVLSFSGIPASYAGSTVQIAVADTSESPIAKAPTAISRSDVVKAVLKAARSQIGMPYGDEGHVAATLTQYAFAQGAGISLNGWATTQQEFDGVVIAQDELKAGDLIFLKLNSKDQAKYKGHVQIYSGLGNVIEAVPGKGVVERPMSGKIAVVKRVLTDEAIKAAQAEIIAEAKRAKTVTLANVLKIEKSNRIANVEKLLGPYTSTDTYDEVIWYNWSTETRFVNVDFDATSRKVINLSYMDESKSEELNDKLEKVFPKLITTNFKDASFPEVIKAIGINPNEVTWNSDDNVWTLSWVVRDEDDFGLWENIGIWAEFEASDQGARPKLRKMKLQVTAEAPQINIAYNEKSGS